MLFLRSFVLSFLSILVFSASAYPEVTIFGKNGTFGLLGNVTPSGQPLTKVAVPGWEIDPGLTYFYPALTSDGTVFIGNMVQTNNQFLRSSCSTVVSCFNPDAPRCYDTETGTSEYFSNIRIPTVEGLFWNPAGSEIDCDTLAPFQAEGADVSDVQTIVDPALGERVFFNSAWGSLTSGPTTFPAVGSIHDTPNGWALDAGSVLDPIDLYLQNEIVCDASLAYTGLCLSDADCGGSTCDYSEAVLGSGKCVISCASDDDCTIGHLCEGGKCRNPTCAEINETAVLPASNRIVVAHYLGRLSVMDVSGNILAGYRVETDTDPCNPQTTMSAGPRSIAADPTSELGDERFVVDFDSSNLRMGKLTQEYSYDEIERTITPVSARLYPVTPSFFHSPSCSDGFTNVTGSAYDQDGNLWIQTSLGLAAARTHVFLRDQQTNNRKLETDCSWLDPDTGSPRPFGFLCESDLDVGRAVASPGLEWGFTWAASPVADSVSGAVIIPMKTGRIGTVKPYTTSSGGSVYAVTDDIVLGQALLPSIPGEEILQSTKAIIDEGAGHVWLPVKTGETVDPCGFFDCVWAVGVTRNSWLYRVGLDAALNDGIQILGTVTAPDRFEHNQDVKIEFTATFDGPLHGHSGLYVYHNGASVPDLQLRWTRKSCRQGQCLYKAKVSKNFTKNNPGMMRWYGVIMGSGGSPSLLAAGRVEIYEPGSCATDCNDGVSCTIDICDAGTSSCVHVPDDGQCDDGLACDGAESCHPSLGCQPGPPLVCDDGSLCTSDSCDDASGCVFDAIDCGDGDACTADVCESATGLCSHEPLSCDDASVCTTDTCDLASGCVNTPTDCSDGTFCNGAETCDPVSGCQAGSDPCPGLTCDELNDQCVGEPDVITISKAQWNAGKQQLVVQATSSDQPDAVLTVVGFGQMTFRKRKYELKIKPVAYPETVTVTSSLGGSDTAAVTIR